MRRHGVPEQLPLAGREANEAAIPRDHAAHGMSLDSRPSTSLNTMVAQEHRGVKRVTPPLRGCTSVAAAQDTRTGSALRPMRKPQQLVVAAGDEGLTAAALFSSLAASSPHRLGQLPSTRLHTKICDKAMMIAWPNTEGLIIS
jgi:hypothetical protein